MAEQHIVVHPLVLLSILDHYTRMDSPRVAGLILGSGEEEVHITNSFAVPFEEDENENAWFFDTSFQQNMFELFKKIHSNEKILGWYHSGTNLHKNDSEITASLLNLVPNPVLLIVDIHSEKNGFPIKVFQLHGSDLLHVSSCIEAEEAEEVGVEHLIRDIKYNNYEKNKAIKESLTNYAKSLETIEGYLGNVISGKMQKNSKILSHLQMCLNDIPILVTGHEENSIECYSVNLVRSVVAVNDLDINRNKNMAH